eukprot:scaffold14991_cov43-Prasinocladus_malaysianus.AAC.1
MSNHWLAHRPAVLALGSCRQHIEIDPYSSTKGCRLGGGEYFHVRPRDSSGFRARQEAAGPGQDRPYLEESAFIQEVADVADYAGARGEDLWDVCVAHQIKIPLAVPRLLRWRTVSMTTLAHRHVA